MDHTNYIWLTKYGWLTHPRPGYTTGWTHTRKWGEQFLFVSVILPVLLCLKIIRFNTCTTGRYPGQCGFSSAAPMRQLGIECLAWEHRSSFQMKVLVFSYQSQIPPGVCTGSPAVTSSLLSPAGYKIKHVNVKQDHELSAKTHLRGAIIRNGKGNQKVSSGIKVKMEMSCCCHKRWTYLIGQACTREQVMSQLHPSFWSVLAMRWNVILWVLIAFILLHLHSLIRFLQRQRYTKCFVYVEPNCSQYPSIFPSPPSARLHTNPNTHFNHCTNECITSNPF